MSIKMMQRKTPNLLVLRCPEERQINMIKDVWDSTPFTHFIHAMSLFLCNIVYYTWCSIVKLSIFLIPLVTQFR